MTEQKFQAPPLPKSGIPTPPAPGISPQQAQSIAQPVFTPEAQEQNAEKADTTMPVEQPTVMDGTIMDLGLPPQLFQTKIFMSILGGIFVFAMMLGAMIFGGSSTPSQNKTGLQGVVPNPEIKQNIPRCGMADRTAPCVLYIVNASRNDRLAEDFFDEAVKLTGRQKYLLTIENSGYAKTRIAPGYFAQIKVPALK